MLKPIQTCGRALWRNRTFIVKTVNAVAVVAIVGSFSSWASATAAAEAQAQAEATAAARSGTRGAYATDGTFEGTAQGYGGPVASRVEIKDGYIESVEVVDHAGETPAYYSQAETLTQKIVDAQGTAVDAVSGATFSSAGIINGVNEALAASNAGGEQ